MRWFLMANALFVLVSTPVTDHDNRPPQLAGILILGDSNSEGPFGATLYEALRAMREPDSGLPVNVKIFAKCGAGADDWIVKEKSNIDCGAWTCGAGLPIHSCRHFEGGSIPALRDLYAELQTDRRVTIVILGLNMIIGKRTQKLNGVANLIGAIHEQHSACIWIGPPQPGDLFVDPAVFKGFVDDLKRTVIRNDCRYIGSDDKTDREKLGKHTKDDHYAKPDAVAWAMKVLDELNHPSARGDKPLVDLLRGTGTAAPGG